jgi:hypothetical protein
VSKKPAAKRAKTGTSRAAPSKTVSPLSKVRPSKKIGVVKVIRPRVKIGPQGMSEIELVLVKPVGVSKKFCLLDVAAPWCRPHHDSCW